MQIVHRFHFASHLKRMAVIVRVQEEFLAFVKVGHGSNTQELSSGLSCLIAILFALRLSVQ